MAAARRSRGRLPARVYWFRRGLVLAVLLPLVVGLAHLLGGNGSDAPPPQATPAGAQPTSAPPAVYGPQQVTGLPKAKKSQAVLADPSGPCANDEISVVPSVPKAEGGGRIQIVLQLQGTQPACTFEVSHESVVVKIATEDDDSFWTTQECPRAVSRSEVVVRSSTPTEIVVNWSGRGSDIGCTQVPDWALPGFYDVYAAVQGSTPSDVEFEVTRPAVRYVTQTPSPTASPSGSPTGSPSASPSR